MKELLQQQNKILLFDLEDTIVAVNEDKQKESGIYPHCKTPSASTVKFYQLLSVENDPNVHLVREDTVKIKDQRRQMASTSVSSCPFYVCQHCSYNSASCHYAKQ